MREKLKEIICWLILLLFVWWALTQSTPSDPEETQYHPRLGY